MACQGRCFTALGAQHFLQGECSDGCHLEPCANSAVCDMWQPAHVLAGGGGVCSICQLVFGARLDRILEDPEVVCGICFDPAGPDTPIFLLPNCRHGTCADCMRGWLPVVVLDRPTHIPPKVMPAAGLWNMDPALLQQLFETIERHTDSLCSFLGSDRNLAPTCHTCRQPCALSS